MELPIDNDDNVEYIRPIQPEFTIVWNGLIITVSNTRLTREQLIKALEEGETMPPAA